MFIAIKTLRVLGLTIVTFSGSIKIYRATIVSIRSALLIIIPIVSRLVILSIILKVTLRLLLILTSRVRVLTLFSLLLTLFKESVIYLNSKFSILKEIL